VQESSSGGHHHNAHLFSRLGWRSAPGGGRPRKAGGLGGGLGVVGGGGGGRRSTRFTLLDGTAVAMALMCQTAEVTGKTSTRDDGEQTQRELSPYRATGPACMCVCRHGHEY